MFKALLILAFIVSPNAAFAVKPSTCLIEFGYNLFDRAYAQIYPGQPSPTIPRRAARARAVELATRLEHFRQMPHAYPKFSYALDQLDELAIRLANMRRAGLRSSFEVADVIRSRDALDVYTQFVDHALLRSFSQDGGTLIDFEPIPLTEEDDRYAREVLKRAGQAIHEELEPVLGRTPPQS